MLLLSKGDLKAALDLIEFMEDWQKSYAVGGHSAKATLLNADDDLLGSVGPDESGEYFFEANPFTADLNDPEDVL